MIKLAIVSPCYNEELVINRSASSLTSVLNDLIAKQKISADSFILYVNDGSKDNTWPLIKKISKENKQVHGLSLANNVGHQNAIMAGMMKVLNNCDAVITIDADLQDDLNAIEKMVDCHNDGNEIVYGVKVSRVADPYIKRFTAKAFYKLQHMMGIKTIYNHADFRLVSSKVLDSLSQYKERNLYLRGIIASMGFRYTTVDDVISERIAGQSKYNISKMSRLALDGITSFTTRPIDLIIGLGIVSLFISFAIIIHVLISWMNGNTVPGWTEIMVSIWFIGSAIILSIGVVGEYICKIYKETKNRPLYIEDEEI